MGKNRYGLDLDPSAQADALVLSTAGRLRVRGRYQQQTSHFLVVPARQASFARVQDENLGAKLTSTCSIQRKPRTRKTLIPFFVHEATCMIPKPQYW